MKKSSTRERTFLRALIAFAVISALFLATSVNLGIIQLVKSDEYKLKAEQNQLYDTTVAAQRGVIYDTKGIVLAQSASVWKIYIEPHQIPNEEVKNVLCQRLSEILDVSYDSVKAKADLSDKRYLTVKSQVEFATKEQVVNFLKEKVDYTETVKNEDGTVGKVEKTVYFSSMVGIDPDVKRYYPCGTLASTILGFTSSDAEGLFGIELRYDSILAGTPGRIITAQNGVSDTMPVQFETVYDAHQGTSLVLTIDEVIQRYLEDGLRNLYETSNGIGAYGVVMDVNTGGILAMASMTDYDPNSPYALTEEEQAVCDTIENEDEKNNKKYEFLYKKWKNFIVGATYEPGSVFKVVTACAGLEEGVIEPDMNFYCSGNIKVASETIRCHKRTGHGSQTLTQGLMNSCNPFFITIGQKVGIAKFYEYFEAFGFTEKTGIDLPSEIQPVAGNTYHTLESMGIVELSSCSFGQSFEVSPIQMITAISAVANGGYLMQPYIVSEMRDSNGNTISKTNPTVRRQVVSSVTAERVAMMMEQVVENGTGKNAYVSGYRVAGKTGTSQKLGKVGSYVASFAGFAPVDDAQIAVLIICDEPQGQINGGQICAPVASMVIENALEYLSVERQYSEEELEKLNTTPPNVINQSVQTATSTLKDGGFTVKIVGEGDKVVSQMPVEGSTIPQNGVVVLYTEENAERLTTTVPDLTGMTISQATKYAAYAGLNIKICGNSLNESEMISYNQSLPAEQVVEYGRTISVYFKSNENVSEIG